MVSLFLTNQKMRVFVKKKKVESVQYSAALAITGSIQGTSRLKLYKELGFETLKSRRWLKIFAASTRLKIMEFHLI